MSDNEAAEPTHDGPNGAEPAQDVPDEQDGGTLSATDFGDLHEKLREDLDQLHASTKIQQDAIKRIAKELRGKAHLIKFASERWDAYHELRTEVRKLKTTNKEMWKLRTDQVKEHEATIAELTEQAKAGEKQKAKYEWKTTELASEYQQKQQKLEQEHEEARERDREELEKAKKQVEDDNADKITTLEKRRDELTSSVEKLEQDLKEKEHELARERENDKRLQESLSKDIALWEGRYKEVVAKYEVEERASQSYAESYQGIVEMVRKIADTYFGELPESAKENPTSTYLLLAKRMSLPFKIPVLGSECAKVLRLASVHHVIFETICKSLWQPFLSEYLMENTVKHNVVMDIYAQLEAEGPQVQSHWKISTSKALSRLDAGSDSTAYLNLRVGEVIEMLRPLLDDRQTTLCQGDLRQLFIKAIELGKTAERDRSPVLISRSPSLEDDGWHEYFESAYEESEVDSPSPPLMEQQQQQQQQQQPFYVSPKIYRPATAGREEQVIHPGCALFPGTRIFQMGRVEWDSYRKIYREAAMSMNIARERRMSTDVPRDRRMSMDSAMVASSPTFWGNGAMNGSILMKV